MASLEEAIRVLGDLSESRHRRCLAARAVGTLGGLEYISLLMKWMDDPAVGERCHWAYRKATAVAKARPADSVEELLRGVRADPDRLSFWECGQRIGQMRARRATRELISIVRETTEFERRAAALHSLWLLDDPRATDVCLLLAADWEGETEHTRLIAVEALGISIHRPYVQRAVARYLSDPLPTLRYSALCATGRLYGRPMGPVLRAALESATGDSASVYKEGDIAALARKILSAGC
ncbi:MAG: HEAT repeat domain-containing protein [Bryobacteraceae bacterium]